MPGKEIIIFSNHRLSICVRKLLDFTVFKSYRFVIISDSKLAREAYAEPALNGRPDLKLFNIHGGGEYG